MVVIECLEELLCPNTAEVVLMWIWTVCILDASDRDSWKLIEGKTLAFYRAQGMARLNALSLRIIDATMKTAHHNLLWVRRWDPRCRVEDVRLPVRRWYSGWIPGRVVLTISL